MPQGIAQRMLQIIVQYLELHHKLDGFILNPIFRVVRVTYSDNKTASRQAEIASFNSVNNITDHDPS
jgi:hypothetical protein